MMTVSELRKALKGVRGNLPVYWADHDHGTYHTNSLAGEAKVLNQADATGWDKDDLNRNPEFKIKGPYFLIRP